MLLLNLDDAIKVTRQYMIDSGYHFFDEEDWIILWQEMEQKCYPMSRIMQLHDLVVDINPKEIAAQIENDNLANWCKTMQREFIIRGILDHEIQTKN